ncbi:MAG: hypothetical protein H6567_09310 [Lewinellaceae bacterium]|nr:hypothetical protein [Lewinellaceae bacterium]
MYEIEVIDFDHRGFWQSGCGRGGLWIGRMRPHTTAVNLSVRDGKVIFF